jgi:K(+)-stimulated pyrophosphate-energized sodium pump
MILPSLLLSGIIGLLFSLYLFVRIIFEPSGNDRMKEISKLIQDGAMAYLKRQYATIGIFMLVAFAGIYFSIGLNIAIAYVGGGLFSILAGVIGMSAATRANVRTTAAAQTKDTGKALGIAFRGGAVMGMAVASLGVIGIALIMILIPDNQLRALIVTGFSMGASSVALFARVGGGIYTKSADVGADLVGKVEQGIPEDDPRNPAAIADNVGDNVGDVAGMGADLFESYVGSVVATVALGVLVAQNTFNWMVLPLALISAGTLASMIGVLFLSAIRRINPQLALRYSTYLSMVLFLGASYYLTLRILPGSFGVFWAILSGIIVGIAVGYLSEYYTSGKTIDELAKSCETGAATNIINGLALGMRSTVFPMLAICAAILISFKFSGLKAKGLSLLHFGSCFLI